VQSKGGNKMIDLIGKRNYFFIFSIIIICIGLFMFITKGFVYDIQFQGGTIMSFEMENGDFEASKAESILTTALNKKVTAVKTSTNLSASDLTDFSASKDVVYFLSVNVSSENALNNSEQDTVKETILKEFNVKKDAQVVTDQIEPSIGKELKTKSIIAVIVSSILIVFYIWVRFNVMSGLSAGVTAIIGLLHDVAIMLSVYLIFRVPLNESFIAAMLTIMGYSMNDTIIIYDRIRENSNLLKKVAVAELTNRSIMQTLSRSINTTVTVLISITTVYVFASINHIESIKEFAFPLIVGIASGCYSSIFIAAPLWVMWKEKITKKPNITPKSAAV
jgi:preprotein translocase subunit SecF